MFTLENPVMGICCAILKSGRPQARGSRFAWLLLAAIGFVSPALSTRAAETNSALQLARQLNDAFSEVAEKASPTVVVINVIQNPATPSFFGEEENTMEIVPPELKRFLQEHYGTGEPRPTPGEGSGVIIRGDGYILTNGHVVDRADRIDVRLKDGRVFHAKVRGVDPQSDVAVLKIEAKDLPAARLADSSKTKVGEFAIAIGSPFDLDYTVTIGHVSAKGRSNIIQGQGAERLDQDYLQTDALINPGNSGGPLLNLDGEVIGINTLIRGLHSGIGFAIPSNLAREISDKLIADGKFPRPWLGVAIRTLRESPVARENVRGVDDGVVVEQILPGGPASKSDLENSDIITAVDGKQVASARDLRTQIRGKDISKPVTFEVYRPDDKGGGRKLNVPIKLAEWVMPQPKPVQVAHTPLDNYVTEIGITVHILNAEIATLFHVERTEGVLVLAVETNTPAARVGLQLGDIVTSVDKHPVNTPRQFRDALKGGDLKKGISLELIRSSKPFTEVLKEEK